MAEPYFRQLLSGREVAKTNLPAEQMANFMYLVGDRDAGECVIVDPAWDVDGLLDVAAADDMKVTGALVTHYHPDHVGGQIFGLDIEGLPRLLEKNPVKIYVNKHEAEGLKQVTGVSDSDLVKVDSGDTMSVGGIEVKFIHTPGHTPGSQCFMVGDHLVSGDTLFIDGCGRVDLPGGDPEQLYDSLTQKLAKLPEDTKLFPGHAYGGATSTIGDQLRTNYYLKVPSLEAWLKLMGR